MTTYELDSEITITGKFTRKSDGSYQDPDGITCFIRDPKGAISAPTYAGAQLTRTAPGVYAYTLTVDVPGEWIYKWLGTGAVQVSSPDVTFTVNPSSVRLP